MVRKLLPVLLLVFCIDVFAADIFVDQSATPGGDGSSWALAFQDIQSAVDVAVNGDTIFIAEGVYQPEAEIDISFPLNIRGGYPQGGGVQNINLYTTQIQADFNPSSLLFRVFDISDNADFSLVGIRFFNVRTSIDSDSNLEINQVIFDGASGNDITLGDMSLCSINNSKFSNSAGNSITTNNNVITNLNISNTLFENGTERAILLGDEVLNFTMKDCVVRNYNSPTRNIVTSRATIANLTNVTVTENISSAVFLVSDGEITFTALTALDNNGSRRIIQQSSSGIVNILNSDFDSNSGTNFSCVQSSSGTLTIDNSTFINNNSDGGAAILNSNRSNTTITNSSFNNNSASGTFNNSVFDFTGNETVDILVTIDNCEFKDNICTYAALEIEYYLDLVLTNCLFENNGGTDSGDLDLWFLDSAIITNNTFKNNSSNKPVIDVGVMNVNAALIDNNTFINNNGPEINADRIDDFTSSNNKYYGDNILVDIIRVPLAKMTDEYFEGNSTGTRFISLDETALTMNNTAIISTMQNGDHPLVNSSSDVQLNIINSTFSATDFNDTNVSIGFNADLASTVRNSIIWSGNNLSQSGFHGNTSNLQTRYSVIKGEDPSGTGNLDGTLSANTPQFIQPNESDFRVLNCSPTVNSGLNTYNSESQDLLGNTRIFETTIDMGAYELQVPANASCSTADLPACTNLIAPGPTDGATGVDLNTTIHWNADPDATGYILRVGTSLGSQDLLDEVLGNQTNYILTDLPSNAPVFVQIVPFNGEGNTMGCTSESFNVAGDSPETLSCTYLMSPADEDSITPNNLAQILWYSVDDADGYRVTVNGSISNVNDITNQIVNGTSHPFTNNFDEGETVTVTIIPFNSDGEAIGCSAPETFTIAAAAPTPPDCTNLSSPRNGDTDIAINLNQITWDAATNATQYRITIDGSTSNLNDETELIVSGTSHPFINDFDNGETVTVTIVPLNDSVEPTTICTPETFTIVAATPTGNPFITTWQTTAPNEDITIPTTGTGYDYNVDWGDGTTTTGEIGDATHTYPIPDVYTISITGDFPRIFFNTNGNPTATDNSAKILTIEQWGSNPWTSMERAFTGCINLTGNFSDIPDLSNVTSTSGMFATCRFFNSNIDNWGMSNVTDVSFMFQNNTSFNQPLNSWDVSNVTNMFIMFQGAVIFDQPLGDWNVENVINADRMFDNATLSTANYDALLIGWNALNLQPNVTFDGGNSQYCDGEAARANMIASDGWTITDDGLAGATVTDLADQTQADSYTLPAIAGSQLTGSEAYYTEPDGGGTRYDAGNVINFADFPSYPVTIYIYDGAGSCASEESFLLALTQNATPPDCTTLLAPADNDTDVAVDLAEITWNAATNATQYRITINASTSDLNDVTDLIVSGTSHPFTNNFDNGETVTVTIVPLNGTIEPTTACNPETFTIAQGQAGCANLITPVFDAMNVPVNTDLTWNTAPNAVRYAVGIGTATGLDDIFTTVDVGNNTTFNPPADLPENTRIFVTISAFNSVGEETVCGDDQFTTAMASLDVPACTTLTSPLNGAIDVSSDTDITWEAVSNADGYRLTIGTSPGGNDIVDNFDAGDTLTFDFSGPFAEGITVYVNIVPYNLDGDAINCTEESFTIISDMAPEIPSCTSLTIPQNGAVDVTIDTDISWQEVAEADGYRISLGTTQGGADILNNEDVGMLTSYQLVEELPFDQQIFVSIIPYNAQGDAENCEEQSFTTIAEETTEIESLNGLSPDGDGINEFWEINGIENYPNNTVVIYNRWGDMVFKIEGYDNAGKIFNGEANQLTGFGASNLPEGTYFFQIIIPEANNLKQTKGYLVLKR